MFEDDDDTDEIDESALSPIMFLLKNPVTQQQQRENFESTEEEEEINRSGNRLNDGELSEFEREWHYHPQPHSMAEDVRVNRIFRTRNVDYYNPDAEAFHHLPESGRYSSQSSSISQPIPIK